MISIDERFEKFKFYDDTEDRAGLVYAGDADRVPINLLHAHNDPFNKECRAFGRLIERKLNGIVAVGCYGYLTIPEKKEEQLEQEFNIGFERLEEEDDNENTPSERRPLCAIVKELIREDVPLSEQVLGKMLRDLKKIRAQGVYPLDIVRRNYKGGRLLDMSIAMTSPHYYFDIWPRWDVELKQREDLLNFDKMVEDEGIDTWRRAVRNDEYCSKLRSYKQISRQTSPDTDESGR